MGTSPKGLCHGWPGGVCCSFRRWAVRFLCNT
nr:MAG TPA: epoxide hydrolase [Caudoviricetes sp.]